MSIGNCHTVNAFVAGTSKAMDGQRLAKVGYKKTKDNPNPLKSVCVSVPMIDTPFTAEQIEKLQDHIVAMVEKAQDGIIRGLYEANPGLMSVGDDEITIEKCIEFLEMEETGGRLTIEKINAWFVDSGLSEKLTEFLRMNGAKKLSGEALEKAVIQSLNGYKGMIAGLSGGKTHYDAKQREKLQVVLAMTEECDDLAEKLNARIEAMAKKDSDIAASLGLIDFE